MELHKSKEMESGSQTEEKPALPANGVANEEPEDQVIANSSTGDQ